ncbi:MAG TPA: MBL fold metallo-hydrolase [Terriglobales bacterium]|nr:MBL fold metallo-hydrolase [Terriglobales bacterium]
MHLRLIRHATLIVDYAGQKILVDPMLDDVAARPPIENSPNPRKNPLVPLPMPAEEAIRGVTAVLVTHTHSDHWDSMAAKLLPKHLPLFGQPEDENKFRSQGFKELRPVTTAATWNGIEFTRTECQHGTGDIGAKMAPASGFVFEAQGEPSFYIAGDTVWCRGVAETIRDFQPKITVVNAGAAQFLQGDPITMTADCVVNVCRSAINAQVVAVHMEAINHCLLTRTDLAFQLESARVRAQVAIPNDGESVQ